MNLFFMDDLTVLTGVLLLGLDGVAYKNYFNVFVLLYVLVMSRMCFMVNPQSFGQFGQMVECSFTN